MKPHRRHLLAAALVAATGFGAALAQTAPAAPMGHGHDPARIEQFRARMEQRVAQRLNELKQKLAITPAQEGAWTTWTAAMKPTRHPHGDRAEFKTLSTPERIDRMRALRAERNAEMDKRMDATKTFYASLDAEQKKTFDSESARFLGGHHHGRRHGHHGEPGQHDHARS